MKILFFALLALPALAQTVGSPEAKAKAREYFRTGTQHYELSEFPEALNDFKEAYRLYEEPTFLFNIGQCHRQMNQKEQAVRFFKMFLSKAPDAPNKSEVRETISKLEAALATAPSPAPQVAPPPAPTTATTTVTTTTTEKPIYKKWWLWTAVGVVVAVGVGVGLGVGLSSNESPTARTDLGTYKPF